MTSKIVMPWEQLLGYDNVCSFEPRFSPIIYNPNMMICDHIFFIFFHAPYTNLNFYV
jgi:hypothetical protein